MLNFCVGGFCVNFREYSWEDQNSGRTGARTNLITLLYTDLELEHQMTNKCNSLENGGFCIRNNHELGKRGFKAFRFIIDLFLVKFVDFFRNSWPRKTSGDNETTFCGKLTPRASFWYIIDLFLVKFVIRPFFVIRDLGWPLMTLSLLFFVKASFWYIIYLLLMRFEIWPYMTPNLKFDTKPFFFLKLCLGLTDNFEL